MVSDMDDYYDDEEPFEFELTSGDVLAMFAQLRAIGAIDENGEVVDDGAVIVVNNEGFQVFVNEH